MVRQAAVAGQFYPASEKLLLRQVESLIDRKTAREDAIGVVSPHAGYIYSGSVAGSTLASIKSKSTYIIMGPNHTGLGAEFSLSRIELWETPLGKVKIDKPLANQIAKSSRYIKEDDLAHSHEHSIEVQLPFLQTLQKDFAFVPIVISSAELDIYRVIGIEVATSIKELKLEDAVTIIASSDMTHYEPHEIARKKDSLAIEAILELDEEKLVASIDRLNISMCGYAPVAIMLVAAKELGAKKGRLVKYQTSGDASGDYSSVVGYAGIIIS
ncbi:MAG: AmmeMemoRadiSam system protein B [Candidatus Omnitrophica bacterium]|nr:AmmeMemoRadiSam system protein B [Candidatus Omnitrophota bacterium]